MKPAPRENSIFSLSGEKSGVSEMCLILFLLEWTPSRNTPKATWKSFTVLYEVLGRVAVIRCILNECFFVLLN